jgi:hypothetical protein
VASAARWMGLTGSPSSPRATGKGQPVFFGLHPHVSVRPLRAVLAMVAIVQGSELAVATAGPVFRRWLALPLPLPLPLPLKVGPWIACDAHCINR